MLWRALRKFSSSAKLSFVFLRSFFAYVGIGRQQLQFKIASNIS